MSTLHLLSNQHLSVQILEWSLLVILSPAFIKMFSQLNECEMWGRRLWTYNIRLSETSTAVESMNLGLESIPPLSWSWKPLAFLRFAFSSIQEKTVTPMWQDCMKVKWVDIYEFLRIMTGNAIHVCQLNKTLQTDSLPGITLRVSLIIGLTHITFMGVLKTTTHLFLRVLCFINSFWLNVA